MDVKATVGLVANLIFLLQEAAEAVTHVAVAFDNPITSFRNRLFPGYKSDEGVPRAIRAQFDLAERAVRALGIVVWSMNEYEADDALATAAVRFAPHVEQVRILTPDKDLGQVLRGDHIVQVDRIRRKTINEAAVLAARGVLPSSIPDWLALVGDAADGIPGIAGFGAKSASAILARWEKIEAIPDEASAWDVKVIGAPRLAATLAAQRPEAMLYKQLATLATDVPLVSLLAPAEQLESLAFGGIPREPFESLCDELDSNDLRTRGARLVGSS
jgi:5'-3' exonuclease